MRRLRSLSASLMLAMFAAFAFIGKGHAATSQSLDLHVSIAGTKSVLIVGATYYNFGALPINTSSVSASAITVQNNSTVFVETYTITGANATSGTGGTDWSLDTSTDTDQYIMEAQFSNARPGNSIFAWSGDGLSTSQSTCSPTTHGNGNASESGEGVEISGTRSLWFRMRTPTAVTDGGPHTANITVSVL